MLLSLCMITGNHNLATKTDYDIAKNIDFHEEKI